MVLGNRCYRQRTLGRLGTQGHQGSYRTESSEYMAAIDAEFDWLFGGNRADSERCRFLGRTAIPTLPGIAGLVFVL